MTVLLNRGGEVTTPCLIPFLAGNEAVNSTMQGEMVTFTLALSFLYISHIALMAEVFTPRS